MGDLLEEARSLVSDDYESPGTIAKNLSERMGREVSPGEARDALLSLTHSGEVCAHAFDRGTQSFVRATNADIASEVELWFLARNSES